MAQQQISRRSLAARNNGRLGGLKTASTHSAEFLEARAAKAGEKTRDTYGNSYYGFINKSSKRKSRKTIISEVTNKAINTIQDIKSTAELMTAAANTLVFDKVN